MTLICRNKNIHTHIHKHTYIYTHTHIYIYICGGGQKRMTCGGVDSKKRSHTRRQNSNFRVGRVLFCIADAFLLFAHHFRNYITSLPELHHTTSPLKHLCFQSIVFYFMFCSFKFKRSYHHPALEGVNILRLNEC